MRFHSTAGGGEISLRCDITTFHHYGLMSLMSMRLGINNCIRKLLGSFCKRLQVIQRTEWPITLQLVCLLGIWSKWLIMTFFHEISFLRVQVADALPVASWWICEIKARNDLLTYLQFGDEELLGLEYSPHLFKLLHIDTWICVVFWDRVSPWLPIQNEYMLFGKVPVVLLEV